MSDELRLLGREVSLRLSQNNVLKRESTAIKSTTIEVGTKLLSEKYLGESGARQDEIFEEIRGNAHFHITGTELLALQNDVYKRSRKRTANPTVFSMTFRCEFPDGSIARISVPDVKFEPIPFNVTAQDAYVEMTLTWKAERYSLTL